MHLEQTDKRCPYACNVETVTQWAYEYDTEGRQSGIIENK